MKYLLLLMLVITANTVKAQNCSYREYEVCTDSATYKGKINHGKKYCIAWTTIKEYKDGRKDTVGWTSGSRIFGNEYENYQRLSERGKYIVDSLKEDGLAMYQENYLTYEPMYMKQGEKVEQLWRIIAPDVFIYEYRFWNKGDAGHGIKLIKCYTVK